MSSDALNEPRSTALTLWSWTLWMIVRTTTTMTPTVPSLFGHCVRCMFRVDGSAMWHKRIAFVWDFWCGCLFSSFVSSPLHHSLVGTCTQEEVALVVAFVGNIVAEQPGYFHL